MSDTEVHSNYHWRPLLNYYELSEKRQAEARSDYDYLSEEEIECESWIVYRDRLYATCDFMRVGYSGGKPPELFNGWHGYLNDSFFSGIVIRFSDCGDGIQIGTFY